MDKIAYNELVYLPVEQLVPHPDNPRTDLGDLTELAASIRINGVYQNLTVVPAEEGYTIIIGHRRAAAAKLAGLDVVPCVIADMSPQTQIRTMLLENMQRTDLTAYEQAKGFQMMLDMGDTVEQIAERTGFSETTVRRRVKMNELDADILKEVSGRQILLGDFDRLAQIEDLNARNECLAKIGTSEFNQTVASRLRLQNIKKNLPAMKQQLKEASMTKLKSADRYSSKYEGVGNSVNIADWDGETPLFPKKIKGLLYYYLEANGWLYFYRKRTKAAPVRRSTEELEREKRIDAAHAEAKELAAVAYKLRSEFVAGISLNSRNATAILKGALAQIVLRAESYVSVNGDAVRKILDVESVGHGWAQTARALAALDNVSANDYAAMIYAGFADKEDAGYATNWSGEFPRHSPNRTLDAIYTWLCSLGYEMSGDEKALQDGTHPLFKRGESE